MIPVYCFGGYRNRNPLSYDAIRTRLGDRVRLVDTPADARLLVISHHADFDLFGSQIYEMLAAVPDLRLVLLSEEPFWDSIWMPDPLSRHQFHETVHGVLPYTVLNHVTSDIYKSERIPYFLLTDPRYIAHYRPMTARNAGMSATAWHHHFSQARADAVFLNIRRTGQVFSPCFVDADMWALSVYRSNFAAQCIGRSVVRKGYGWEDAPLRQELDDWHRDKLVRFDHSCRYMSAFENTHHPDYVSEKIYDAFAVGAVPLYYASSGHRVSRLLGTEGWRNFYDHTDTIPVFDAERPVDQKTCEGYARTQEYLARLFDDRQAIEAEYERLCVALVHELNSVISGRRT